MGTTSFNFNFYKIKQICNIIEHNPVYYSVFKYHKFTQIVPTKSAVFAQFFANPKSQKFLKLNFHVFGSRKSYESKINFIWRVKKIVIKLFFRFWNPIQVQKTILSPKKKIILFCQNSAQTWYILLKKCYISNFSFFSQHEFDYCQNY